MSITSVIDEFDKLNNYEQKKVYDIIYSAVNNSSNRVGDYLTEIRVSTKHIDNYLYWHRFLELYKSLDKEELKKTLLTQVIATCKSTTVRELRPSYTA